VLPEFPEELEHLWRHFVRLSGRRQAGMAANPITYQEVEAYERKSLARLTAWEVGVIMRLDDAVLGVWANNQKPAPKPDAPADPIPANDTVNMKAMFRGLATAKRSELAARKGAQNG
jgi:hypothetical protein